MTKIIYQNFITTENARTKNIVFNQKWKGFMSNLGFSYIAIHPGEMLKEELESRGITQKEFAKAIEVSYTMLNEILNGKRSITADFAILIEAALGTPAEHWLNMQARYNLQTARRKETVISRFNSIRNMTTWFSPKKKAEVATI